MKSFPNELYQGPLEGLVFDMDNTLYTHPAYARHQEEILVDRLAREKGWDHLSTQVRLDEYRNAYAQDHSGHLPSLGNSFLAFGISISTNVLWRNQEIQVEKFLTRDEKLSRTLSKLSKKFRLSIVTNNPIELAQRTLGILGVLDEFSALVGLDSLGVSKPYPPSFSLAAELMKCDPRSCMTIGDRYKVDIWPGLEVGMLGLLVTGVEEIYTLPEYFETVR